MLPSQISLDDASIFEAAQLDAIALLADTWDSKLDPEVSAQLVQANVRAHFSFGKEKGKGKGKGKFPVRSSRLPLSNRRRQLKELRERTEFNACGRKGHWAHDYECTMSPFSLFPEPQTCTARVTTRQHLSSQPVKVTTCFVLDDCGDDSETFANTVDGEVSFSMEPTRQTSPTPIAYNAVDTGKENILNIHRKR